MNANYLWPFDKLCSECFGNIHLSDASAPDMRKVTFESHTYYYCFCPHCGAKYRIPSEQIPANVQEEIPFMGKAQPN